MLAAVFEIGWRWDRDFALRRSAVSQPRANIWRPLHGEIENRYAVTLVPAEQIGPYRSEVLTLGFSMPLTDMKPSVSTGSRNNYGYSNKKFHAIKISSVPS
jgi:hypothetical protein